MTSTDWQDLLFPGGAIYNAHLNISGGSEKATYSVSLDYFDEKGVVPSTFYKYHLLMMGILIIIISWELKWENML